MRTKYLTARYVIDRAFAAVTLIVISPLLVAIAMVLVRSQGRPILFRQQRVGRHGRTFTILKFRTMVEGAEQVGGGYPVEGRDVITPMGTWLRKTSLDELPQLINIMRGDMALIGPRPSMLDQYQRYTPFQRRRADVLPGVTGLAQVTYRDNAPWSKRIELDVEYVERANPFMDISIMFRTMRRMLRGSWGRSDLTRRQVDDLG